MQLKISQTGEVVEISHFGDNWLTGQEPLDQDDGLSIVIIEKLETGQYAHNQAMIIFDMETTKRFLRFVLKGRSKEQKQEFLSANTVVETHVDKHDIRLVIGETPIHGPIDVTIPRSQLQAVEDNLRRAL